MKVRKVHFGDNPINKDCKRELLKRPDIPVCVKRTGNTIHTDFRPVKPPKPQPGPGPTPGPTPQPEPTPSPSPTPSPTPTPPPEPKPTPTPSGPSGGGSGLPVGAIIASAVGTAGALGAIGAGLRSGSAVPEIDSAVANMELGDATAGFQTAEEATQGFTTGFQQVSQAGLTSRAGAQTTVSEIEMTTSEITPAVAETEVAALEIGGEAVAVAETAGAVGAGIGAGILAGAGAVAMGAVATVGELGYFVDKGLFDFKSQANAFQKGAYNTQQEVAQLSPPKLRYIEPPPMFASTAETMAYFQQRDQAQVDYQNELSAYNTAVIQQGPKTALPSP